MTSGTRPGEEGPLWTIAGNQAEQSLTRGAVRRLRDRPSRQRLQRRGVPGDAQEWPQTRHGGVHHHAEVQRQFRASGAGRPPDHTQHVKKRAEENTWVSTWTGEQLVETMQALDEPRHHTAKTVCVRRSRWETDALANSDAGGASTAQEAKPAQKVEKSGPTAGKRRAFPTAGQTRAKEIRAYPTAGMSTCKRTSRAEPTAGTGQDRTRSRRRTRTTSTTR